MTDKDTQLDMWRKMTEIVEGHNEPGTFSAIIGYEWTSNYGGGNNLHRNVIYRGDKAEADRVRPLTTFDTEIPNELWDWMAMYEEETGGRVLAIPHNGNLSNGLMFATETPDGQPIDAEWARSAPAVGAALRGHPEQGHLGAAPEPRARRRVRRLRDLGQGQPQRRAQGTGHDRVRVRPRGAQARLGAGGRVTAPTRSSSASSARPTTIPASPRPRRTTSSASSRPASPSPERSTANAFDFEGRTIKDWQLGASGLTAVWATENTRAAIWDAMKRKEVYGTTGPRIAVRFFGGWDFVAEDAQGRNPGAIGYGKGVPMGGDLHPAPEGAEAPSFLVAALKDPLSGNLDRIQIIKGWVDAAGEMQEQIYDVAWSGDREPGEDGKVPAVGDTVDLSEPTWTNTIGAPELITVWQDPDFDPALKAFYYARVIEIPTPRWTAYDAAYFEEADFAPEVPMTLQERAYTSPIWYAPEN